MAHTDGIDVSHWQGDVDFSKVAQAGVQYVFMKCSGGQGKDEKFDTYYKDASKFISNLGCYIYNLATTVEAAKKEAAFALKCIGDKQFSLGVWLDLEYAPLRSLSKKTLTTIIHTEAEILRNAGFKVGIYCNYDWYKNVLDSKLLATEFPFWLARYSNDGNYNESLSPKNLPGVKLWQYSYTQHIAGIAAKVDTDHSFAPISEWWNLTPIPVAPTSSGAYSYMQFVKDVQKALGVTPDGIAGPKTLSATVTISKSQNNHHAAVKPIQQYLNLLGYDCGTADGIAGANFDSAVKKFQTDKGCTADGEITAKGKTWQKLLEK